jgi:hypothetical protein
MNTIPMSDTLALWGLLITLLISGMVLITVMLGHIGNDDRDK